MIGLHQCSENRQQYDQVTMAPSHVQEGTEIKIMAEQGDIFKNKEAGEQIHDIRSTHFIYGLIIKAQVFIHIHKLHEESDMFLGPEFVHVS